MKHTVQIQRIEAAFLLAGSIFLYIKLGYNFLYFVPALFLIDFFAIGYVVNKRIGAYVYNVGHSFIAPVILFSIGIPVHNDTLIALGLIWVGHIGMDRAMGYGLKHRTGFTDTHLGKIGKK